MLSCSAVEEASCRKGLEPQAECKGRDETAHCIPLALQQTITRHSTSSSCPGPEAGKPGWLELRWAIGISFWRDGWL